MIVRTISNIRQTLANFLANQGFLLAGAIAYYALLSLLPLLILSVVGLSHLIERQALINSIGLYLEWLLPSTAAFIVADVVSFLDHRDSIGLVMFGTLLFFSAQAFSVLEKAMAVIFAHRNAGMKRHFLISALLPYSLVLVLGLALLLLTLGSAALEVLAQENLNFFGQHLALSNFAGFLLPVFGIALVTLVLTIFYLIVPLGRTRILHALWGGLAGALLWEIMRHGLIWYFGTISRIGVVYGSLSSTIVLLFCLELAAILLLLGAQVIADIECRQR